jgi:hypothetical protein
MLLLPCARRDHSPDKDPHDQYSPEQIDTQQQHDGDKDLVSHPRGHVFSMGEWPEFLSMLLGDEVPFVPYTDEYTEVLVVSEIVPDLSLAINH